MAIYFVTKSQITDLDIFISKYQRRQYLDTPYFLQL
jgi:hypothetical protein